jgi:uncharacterized protein (TIGR03066 family)
MRHTILTALLGLFALGASAFADDKKEESKAKESLVGTWEVAKGDLPKGSTIQFTKDGNMTLTVNSPSAGPVPIEGTYELKGKSLKTVTKDANRETTAATVTIKALTQKRLVLVGEKGDELELTKK